MVSVRDSGARTSPQEITLGLIPAPDMPEAAVAAIIDGLPALLHRWIDDRLSWRVDAVTDPLIGAEDDTQQILTKAQTIKQRQAWQYAICISDLPMLRAGQLTIAEADGTRGLAMLSLPSLGLAYLRNRLQEAILQLANEMHHGSSEQARNRQQDHIEKKARRDVDQNGTYSDSRTLISRRFLSALVAFRRITPKDSSVDVRFVTASRFRGYLQLLTGMVRANRPWTILPSFKRVVAIAFATGTYGLVFPTLWHLSDAYDVFRLMALTVISFIAMIAWITVAHRLWEPRSMTRRFQLVWLYNMTTLTTLLIGVLCYYVSLFALFLTTCRVFIPWGYFQEILRHPVSWGTYVWLAWLITSVATITGALGLTLESDVTVRNATYGYRQRMRHKKVIDAHKNASSEHK